MKKTISIVLWIAGTITWLLFLLLFRDIDTVQQSHTHEIILIITGILLAIHIGKRMGSGTKELEKENQELKAENQKLREELAEQAVRQAMDKAENRERKG